MVSLDIQVAVCLQAKTKGGEELINLLTFLYGTDALLRSNQRCLCTQ